MTDLTYEEREAAARELRRVADVLHSQPEPRIGELRGHAVFDPARLFRKQNVIPNTIGGFMSEGDE